MKPIIFIATAIDSSPDRGMGIRKELIKILKKKYNVVGAGIAQNPIIDLDKSTTLRKKEIVAQDIQEARNADIILVVTDLNTFSVGTWCEVWEGYMRGRIITLYITGRKKLRNIFLETICHHVIYDIKTLKKDLGI